MRSEAAPRSIGHDLPQRFVIYLENQLVCLVIAPAAGERTMRARAPSAINTQCLFAFIGLDLSLEFIGGCYLSCLSVRQLYAMSR